MGNPLKHMAMDSEKTYSKKGKKGKSRENVEEKVSKIETFLNEKLKADLKHTLDERDKLYESLSEYLQLKVVIERLQDGGMDKEEIKTKVDLGCNFYVQARVPDAKMIYVCVGYGFYVELTLPEAVKFIEKKERNLNEKIKKLTEDASKIKAHIKIVLEGLREVQDFDGRPNAKPFRDILS